MLNIFNASENKSRKKQFKWSSKITALTLRNAELQAKKLQRHKKLIEKQYSNTISPYFEPTRLDYYTFISDKLRQLHIPDFTNVIQDESFDINLEQYFVPDLFHVSLVPAGHLLKKWSDIQGRDINDEVIEVSKKNPQVLTTVNLSPTNLILSPYKPIRAKSPDIFECSMFADEMEEGFVDLTNIAEEQRVHVMDITEREPSACNEESDHKRELENLQENNNVPVSVSIDIDEESSSSTEVKPSNTIENALKSLCSELDIENVTRDEGALLLHANESILSDLKILKAQNGYHNNLEESMCIEIKDDDEMQTNKTLDTSAKNSKNVNILNCNDIPIIIIDEDDDENIENVEIIKETKGNNGLSSPAQKKPKRSSYNMTSDSLFEQMQYDFNEVGDELESTKLKESNPNFRDAMEQRNQSEVDFSSIVSNEVCRLEMLDNEEESIKKSHKYSGCELNFQSLVTDQYGVEDVILRAPTTTLKRHSSFFESRIQQEFKIDTLSKSKKSISLHDIQNIDTSFKIMATKNSSQLSTAIDLTQSMDEDEDEDKVDEDKNEEESSSIDLIILSDDDEVNYSILKAKSFHERKFREEDYEQIESDDIAYNDYSILDCLEPSSSSNDQQEKLDDDYQKIFDDSLSQALAIAAALAPCSPYSSAVEETNENKQEIYEKDEPTTTISTVKEVEINDLKYLVRDSHTPEPTFEHFDDEQLHEELKNFGIKPLKRHQAVKVLDYIYRMTHPFVLDAEEPIENENNISPHEKQTHQQKVDEKRLDLKDCSAEFILQNNHQHVPATLLEAEEYIFQTNITKKTQHPLLPLHLAFSNLIAANQHLYERILMYEPIDVESIYHFFKKIGVRYDPNQIREFIDRRSIVFKYKTTSGSEHKPRVAKRKKFIN